MPNAICLDENYSTTKLLTKVNPAIENSLEDKFETVLFLQEGKNGKGGLRTKGYMKKSYDDKPLVSIITVVFNGEKNLQGTIESVITQNYDNVEYVIIDGGSTDGTVDIIKKYEDRVDFWVSEKDNGISEAFNKGIDEARGEFILMLNCGDSFIFNRAIDSDLLVKNMNKIITFQAKTSYGNIFPSNYTYMTDSTSNCFLRINNFVQNAMVAHQTSFVPKSVYNEIGCYDNKYSIRMDFDFFIRASKKYEIKFYPRPIVLYPTDGISSQLKNRLAFKMEELDAIHNNICNSCLLYDIYFFVTLPIYLFKKLLSSIKYTLLDWRK